MPEPSDPFADIDRCEVCRLEKDTPLQQCARCKGKNYCSTECQKADWKEHRFDCSELLITGDIIVPSVLSCDDADIEAQVKRISQLLAQWELARSCIDYDTIDRYGRQVMWNFPASKDILEWAKQLPVAFQYSRNPPSYQTFIYRKPLMLMTRILFNYMVTTVLSANGRHSLIRGIDAMKFGPVFFFPLHTSKIVARPAGLSPGEYEALMIKLPVFLMMVPECHSIPNDLGNVLALLRTTKDWLYGPSKQSFEIAVR